MKRIVKNRVANSTTERLPSIDLPLEKISSKQARNYRDKKRKSIYIVGKSLSLGIFVVIAMYGIWYAWSWSISMGKAQAETFTELYFEDNLHLPSEIIPKHPYFFQFTIHNLEGKDMEYPYKVYVEVGEDKVFFDQGTIFVKENDYKTMQERFATINVLPKSEIVVDLVNKQQYIDFWIEGVRKLVNHLVNHLRSGDVREENQEYSIHHSFTGKF